MKEPYRFIKRKTKKNIYVIFEHLPGKEFSTGTGDMRQAVVFAETMLRKDWQQFDNSRNRITFGEYAKDFYTESTQKPILMTSESGRKPRTRNMMTDSTNHIREGLITILCRNLETSFSSL